MSVVVPTFEGEGRIEQTLSRLRRQTLTDFEVIVVNDGSTDGTSAIVSRLMKDDARIRLVEQANQGIAAARNRGIEAARADLVAFLDDDDLWLPRKLELQVARLAAAFDAAVVSCWSALIDPAGRLLGWRLGGRPEGDVYREMLEWDMISGGSVALVRRRVLEEAGGFDASLPERADWDLWIRLARVSPFTCVPRTLVGYTRRPDSVSRNYDRMLEQGRAVLAKARQADPCISKTDHRAFLARELFGAACLSLVDGRRSLAWHYLSHAMRAGPNIVLSRPRRWGVIAMLALSTALPERLYRQAVGAMSRAAFQIEAGADFDALA